MTTSAPQWPGREGIHEPREEDRHRRGRQAPVPPCRCKSCPSWAASRARASARQLPADGVASGTGYHHARPAPAASRPIRGHTHGSTRGSTGIPPEALSAARPVAASVAQPEAPSGASPPAPPVAPSRRRSMGRRGPFVVVRDPKERELRVARRRARANLPSPAAVTRDIALALLEVEAGCRSAAQLERVVSPKLWETLERCIGRRGGPLPSGRSVMSVHCQENTPGLADTMAVVRKGDLVRPIALRLDAGGGRWVVTELRWWRNETDTATGPAEIRGARDEPDHRRWRGSHRESLRSVPATPHDATPLSRAMSRCRRIARSKENGLASERPPAFRSHDFSSRPRWRKHADD